MTAQRRAEDLQTVPIALTVLSAQALASQGITDTQKLELVTPGLVFSTFNGAGQPYLRGIGADQLSVGGDSAVALYIDGVYRPGVYSLNQDSLTLSASRCSRVRRALSTGATPPGAPSTFSRAIRPPDSGARRSRHMRRMRRCGLAFI